MRYRANAIRNLTVNPIEDKLGVHMIRRVWDPVQRMETETFHNLQGELAEILCGLCEVHYYLDEQLQLHSAYCYNREGEIAEEPFEHRWQLILR